MMIPKIDPDVKYIGSSKLRDLTAIELRALTGAIVVTGAGNTPLVVILPYETYLKMQEAANAAIDLPDGADWREFLAGPERTVQKGDGKR